MPNLWLFGITDSRGQVELFFYYVYSYIHTSFLYQLPNYISSVFHFTELHLLPQLRPQVNVAENKSIKTQTYPAHLCFLAGNLSFLEFLLCIKFTWWQGVGRQMPTPEGVQHSRILHADVFPGGSDCGCPRGEQPAPPQPSRVLVSCCRKHPVPANRREVAGTSRSRWEPNLVTGQQLWACKTRSPVLKPSLTCCGLQSRRCFSNLLNTR